MIRLSWCNLERQSCLRDKDVFVGRRQQNVLFFYLFGS